MSPEACPTADARPPSLTESKRVRPQGDLWVFGDFFPLLPSCGDIHGDHLFLQQRNVPWCHRVNNLKQAHPRVRTFGIYLNFVSKIK